MFPIQGAKERTTKDLTDLLDIIRNAPLYEKRMNELKEREKTLRVEISRLTKAKDLDKALTSAKSKEQYADTQLVKAEAHLTQVIKEAEDKASEVMKEAESEVTEAKETLKNLNLLINKAKESLEDLDKTIEKGEKDIKARLAAAEKAKKEAQDSKKHFNDKLKELDSQLERIRG